MGNCIPCGGNKSTVPAGMFDPDTLPDPLTNSRGMYLLGNDDFNCEAYHGAFQGTTVFLVGGEDPEKAAIFLRAQYPQAWDYASFEKLSWAHVNVTDFCHERIVTLLGG